ncbi:MAG: heavy metal-responsive transcriptional regulator [Candidatus Tectomicrobia bacterium]
MAKLFKIGELATRSGLSRDTIRFYEREAVLPKPARTQTGYRLYQPEMVERLHFIKRAQALGLSLTEIKSLLDGYQDPEECTRVKHLLEQKIVQLAQKMREIQALHDLLRQYLEACQQALKHGRATEPCPVLLDMLQGPASQKPLQGANT